MAATTWTGPALLVPVTVQAMTLTDSAYGGGAWAWTPPRYTALRTFQQVDAAPLSPQPPSVPGFDRFRGVVLQWALPDGLTQGAQSGSGIAYPPVPNRWLVVRRRPLDTSWDTTAWVVASDYVGGAKGSPWPNQKGTGATTLGMCWPLADWPGEAAVASHAADPPLTAVGAGDPTFAAFAANVGNVFSFGDAVGDVRGPLSYAVLGWYSASGLDPLSGMSSYGPDGWRTFDQWQNLMIRLQWTVGDEADLDAAVQAGADWAVAHGYQADPTDVRTQYPARTLCHGILLGVDWRGTDGPYVSGAPTTDTSWPSYVAPKVAVANSGVDALAAMLADAERAAGMDEKKVDQLVDVLEAFQYNALPLLDERDGVAQLTLAVQQGWYGSTGGGTTWRVVAPRDTTAPSGAVATPDLSTDQAALLTTLNTAQRELDACTALVQSLQWELFALWWKGKRLAVWLPPPKQKDEWQRLITTATAEVTSAISAQLAAYAYLRQRRDDALVRLQPTLGTATLAAGAGAPFRRPADPVVLVNGAGRSYEHGADGRFSDDDTLFCRFTGQTVSGVAVPVGGSTFDVTAADFPPPVWSNPDLPLETADLLAESFFLDIDTAPLIAQSAATKAGSTDPWSLLAAVRAEQTLVWNPVVNPPVDRRTIAEETGLLFMYGLGAIPSKIGVELYAPPWSPLYLDWRFDYYPGSPDQAHALANWELPLGDDSSAPLDEFTYRWTPPEVSRSTTIGLVGRTFLTPQTSDVLAARLEQLIEHYADDPSVQPNLWALQDALAYVQDADLLSQALTGFDLTLLERNPTTFPIPDDPTLTPYLDPPAGPTFTADSTPAPTLPGAAANTFSPIRTGHLLLTQLWVVDAFGQVFKVLDPGGGALPVTYAPIMGTDLVTRSTSEADCALAELKPRITQFSRLRMALLSADDDTAEVGVVSGADPVCGWLIPNHLDRSLLVYDADGDLDGELLLASDRALWLPPPQSSPPPHGGTPAVDIANAHLRAIVEGVLSSTDSGTALRGLLALVDTAFWAINPTGGWADEELPVLIGRPLAVVRARLAFELQGGPAYDQAWSATGKDDTDGFDSVRLPVQLGCTELLDDGLVGFYLDDDYRSIDTVYTTDPNDYVRHDRPELTLGGDAALLTLVMDPQTSVHAISGVLPATVTTLPAAYSSPALGRMAVTFRTGPVVTDPADVTMPLPALTEGVWSWLQYVDTTEPAVERAVLLADATASLPTPPAQLREGWLKLLLDGPPTRLTYAVSPTSVQATGDPGNPTTALLQVTAYNGTGAGVTCQQIELVLPVGASASDLTTDPSTVAATVPVDSGWTIKHDGRGTLLAKPTSASELQPGATLTFTVAGVRVNTQPGTAPVAVRETIDLTREGSLAVTKVVAVTGALLTYTVTPASVPAGTGSASLTVTAYNGTGAAVTCTQLLLTLPVGTAATDLTTNASGIVASAGSGTTWTVAGSGTATLVCTPPAGGTGTLAAGAALTFVLSGITVSGVAGPAAIAVAETAAAGTGSPALARTSVVVAKSAEERTGGKPT